MDRRREILKYADKERLGIEIGPWHSPIAPKREGFNCLVLDVFDGPTLRERAERDEGLNHDIAARDANAFRQLIANIEDVDLLGSVTRIAELAEQRGLKGKLDYIISSHNFEHTPDPIRFLQGCEKVLKPGGVLSMAIPDRRTCFDYFRPLSILPELLEAYFAKRDRPKYSQVFASAYLRAFYDDGGQRFTSFDLSRDPRLVRVDPVDHGCLEAWKQFEANGDEVYRDAHCWIFTPASFELIMTELAFFRLTQFGIVEVSKTNGNEFYAHLRNGAASCIAEDEFHRRREQLLHRMNDEAAENSIRYRTIAELPPLRRIATNLRSFARSMKAMIGR